MGINNLWQVVGPAGVKCSLLGYTTQHAMNPQTGHCKLRIGVDANLWMAKCQHKFQRGHTQMGENPELRLLFYKLAQLHRTLCDVVLVFDGPNRPHFKRGKRVVTCPPWLTDRLKEFAEAFGFSSVDAPGEAEAQLAHMNRSGIIGAVLSDDGDTLVFGALTVLRSSSSSMKSGSQNNDSDSITVFDSRSITDHPEVRLTEGGVFLMAVLCGGDYSNGVPGCGHKTALGLAHYPLGDQLLHASRTLDEADLAQYVTSWITRACDALLSDPLDHFPTREHSVARSIRSQFPKTTILRAYAQPLVDPTINETVLTAFNSPECSSVNVERLAFLCEFRFGWSRRTPSGTVKKLESSGTLGKLENLVYEGTCIRALFTALQNQNHDGLPGQGASHESTAIIPADSGQFGAHSVLGITSDRHLALTGNSQLKQHRVQLNTTPLVNAAKAGVARLKQLGNLSTSSPSLYWTDVGNTVAVEAFGRKSGTCDTSLKNGAKQQVPQVTCSEAVVELSDSDSVGEPEVEVVAGCSSHTLGGGEIIELTDSD
ncbi:hypothetical protein HYDPIDRAFT_28837 [Hydnomerulius pinastri MD-312]|uniref:XPG-I domain-containing protein n=1 Tax=Hydnomerulius pinastri MD-312 TaxID=994086 RepID=A0A0C9WF59_9AGAM|nr:hypothetical protein HYDPIDRAFT_28837 [Hydnomerulius pinastri MD-312]